MTKPMQIAQNVKKGQGRVQKAIAYQSLYNFYKLTAVSLIQNPPDIRTRAKLALQTNLSMPTCLLVFLFVFM